MHELSIISSLVDNVLEFVEREKVARVLCVRIGVGEFTQLETEQLKFGYEAVTKETLLEGSSLEIETVEAAVKCPHCCYSGKPKFWDGALSFASVPTLQCPVCGKAAEATQGDDCAIKTIQFIRENDNA